MHRLPLWRPLMFEDDDNPQSLKEGLYLCAALLALVFALLLVLT